MTRDRSVYRAHTYEDLMNVLPTLFGFVPRESVIGMCVSGDRCRFGFRLRHDLPEPGSEQALADLLAPHLIRNGGDGYFVFALSDDPERARAMALALQDALPPRTCRVLIWADDERIWSDAPWHPADGEPYALSDHHESRVRAVAEGQVVLTDRADLALEVTGPAGERSRWLDQAHEHAIEAFLSRLLRWGPDDTLTREIERATALVDRHLDGQHLTDGDLVELVVAVSSIQVRDHLWLRIDRDNAAAMYALWASACRVASIDFAPAVLCLAGFSAWQLGDGARALTALERATDHDPGYSMAEVLLLVLQSGVHPDTWHREDLPA